MALARLCTPSLSKMLDTWLRTLEPRFQKVLGSLVNATQMQSIQAALAPLAYAVPACADNALLTLH